jgi:hypothetical protein
MELVAIPMIQRSVEHSEEVDEIGGLGDVDNV